MSTAVAVVIPAKDESERIAATIAAAKEMPHVTLVVVVDDGSSDNTQEVARAAGASVVRHPVNRGKAAAMETGAMAVSLLDEPEAPRALLFLDADLGASAGTCTPLITAVIDDGVDCAIACLPKQEGAGGLGIVTGTGRNAIEKLTGWVPQQPLSGQRCMTRAVFDDVLPFAAGWGVEVGMTIDLLVAGYTVQEVPCELHHRVSTNNLAGQLHRADQLKDVLRALAVRIAKRHFVPKERRNSGSTPGAPYCAWLR